MWSENRWFYRCQDSNPQTSWEWTHGLPVHPSVGLQQTKKPVNRHTLQASPSNCQCAFSYGLRSYQEESKIISCVQAPGAKVSYIFQHLTKTHKRHFPRLSFDWHQSIASDRALKHGIWYDPVWAMFTAWQWRCWIYVAQCSLLETECIFFLTHRWILQADPTFSQNCPNWLVNSQELNPQIFASVFFILLTAPQKKATYWYFFPVLAGVVTFSMARTISWGVVWWATCYSQAVQPPWRSYSKYLYEKKGITWHLLRVGSCLQLFTYVRSTCYWTDKFSSHSQPAVKTPCFPPLTVSECLGFQMTGGTKRQRWEDN